MVLPIFFGDAFTIDDWGTAAFAALVIGFINMTLRPILTLLTLPLSWLTMGLWSFVINGFLILVASSIVSGFTIDKFFPTAILASALYSIATALAGSVLLDN